jgi:L-asparaginase II
VSGEASLIVKEHEAAGAEFSPALLVEVRRGSITESRHYGHVVVLEGDQLSSLGAPEAVTFLRSSAKPHQIIPLVATGAADHFNFTDREIAVACGSHNGEAEHTQTVASMLGKIGLDEGALRCGAHEPYGEDAAGRLRERNEKPTALHNNCSGKHAAMLALALYLGAPVENYEEPEHPVQQLIARTIEQFSDVPVNEMGLGADGCSAPNFAVSLRAMALMYARLVRPPAFFDDALRAAAARIVNAMQAHPEMVEGRGELDTELMKACPGRLVSKVGAEGVYTAGILPCERFPGGAGVAFKIEDGDKADRARSPVAVEILRQLDLLSRSARGLDRFARPLVRNHRGDEVGEVVTAFELGRPQDS